jgi:hypothetical protein
MLWGADFTDKNENPKFSYNPGRMYNAQFLIRSKTLKK